MTTRVQMSETFGKAKRKTRGSEVGSRPTMPEQLSEESDPITWEEFKETFREPGLSPLKKFRVWLAGLVLPTEVILMDHGSAINWLKYEQACAQLWDQRKRRTQNEPMVVQLDDVEIIDD